METKDTFEKTTPQAEPERGYLRGRIAGGLLIIGIGGLFLARELGVVLPAWLFTWKMLLLALALYFAIKHLFRHIIWLVLLLAAFVFVSDDLFGIHLRPLTLPVLLIILGFYFMFRPRRKRRYYKKHWKDWKHEHHYDKHWKDWKHEWKEGEGRIFDNSNDYVDMVAGFAYSKSNVISKDFKGGDVVSFFGGSVLDLSQADIQGKVVVDVSAVFGGVTIIVPAHWQVQSEIISVFGGIEDKRPVPEEFMQEHSKILILQGTAVFGGITVQS